MKRINCTAMLLLCLVITINFIGLDSKAQRLEDLYKPDMTPSEFHEILAKQKADRLEKAREATALARPLGTSSTQTNYDVKFYDVFIRINDTTEIIYGYVKFHALAMQDGVSSVEVDLYSNMLIDSISSPFGSLTYSRLGNVVTVNLDKSYNTDEVFDFTVYYNGHPIEGGFQAFAFDWHLGKRSIATLSEPYFARSWWPCKDRMDDKPDSMDISIEVDTSLYVASNGTLDSTVAKSTNTHAFYYTVRYPIVTYLFSLAIYPYTVWTDDYVYNSGADTMLLIHAVYPDQYATSVAAYGETPAILEALEKNFGPYPFINEKYGHANFEWAGGMEHQTMTSMWGGWFGFYEPTIIHEAGHQWWGDMITCKTWGDIWLNEGFASYSEALYYLEKEGWASYHSYMNGMRYTGGGTIYVYDTTSVGNIFHGGRSYDKGAWVVHMLRGVLKDSLFFEGIDAYYNSEYQHGAATTEEFKNVFEAATGEELDWFFDNWIYGDYFPDYRYQIYSRWFQGGYENYVWVKQVQTNTSQVFEMPVDIWLDFSTIPDDTVTFKIDEREKLFKFSSTSLLKDAKLDPSDWILKNATKQPWLLHIITFPEEISPAEQYTEYADTITALGGTGTNTVTIIAGALPTGMSIDNRGIITGTCNDAGLYTFTVDFDDDGTNYGDSKEFSINVASKPLVPGDVAFNDGLADIEDLTYLINYLFLSGPLPTVPALGDLTGDCNIDIADITALINYLFIDPQTVMVVGCA